MSDEVHLAASKDDQLEQPRPSGARDDVKVLPSEFKSGGFRFRQQSREGNVALFEKLKDGIPSFEVVRIQRRGDRLAFGKILPASEVMPSSERWGKDGWTYSDVDSARRKLSALVESREGVALGTPKPKNRIAEQPTVEGRIGETVGQPVTVVQTT